MQVSDKLEIELINTLEYTLTFAKSPRTAAPPPPHTQRSGGPCQKLAKGLSVNN